MAGTAASACERWLEGDRFVHDPALNEKGTGVAIDPQRDVRWSLHDTRGLVVVRGKSPRSLHCRDALQAGRKIDRSGRTS